MAISFPNIYLEECEKYTFLLSQFLSTLLVLSSFIVEEYKFLMRPELINRWGPILLHDCGWLHVARMTLQKLTDLTDETLSYLPYSPDLSPTDSQFYKHLHIV